MEVDKPEVPKENGAEAVASAAAPATLEDKLKSVVALVEKSVKAKDTRLLIGRLLRQTATVRKQLTAANVKAFLRQTLPADLESRTFLTGQVEQVRTATPGACLARLHVTDLHVATAQAASSSMESDEATTAASCESTSVLPEVELYAYLIVLLFLSDRQEYKLVRGLTSMELVAGRTAAGGCRAGKGREGGRTASSPYTPCQGRVAIGTRQRGGAPSLQVAIMHALANQQLAVQGHVSCYRPKALPPAQPFTAVVQRSGSTPAGAHGGGRGGGAGGAVQPAHAGRDRGPHLLLLRLCLRADRRAGEHPQVGSSSLQAGPKQAGLRRKRWSVGKSFGVVHNMVGKQ